MRKSKSAKIHPVGSHDDMAVDMDRPSSTDRIRHSYSADSLADQVRDLPLHNHFPEPRPRPGHTRGVSLPVEHGKLQPRSTPTRPRRLGSRPHTRLEVDGHIRSHSNMSLGTPHSVASVALTHRSDDGHRGRSHYHQHTKSHAISHAYHSRGTSLDSERSEVFETPVINYTNGVTLSHRSVRMVNLH